MKKMLLLLGTTLSVSTYAQTTLFQDNFESGSGSWTLNTGGSGQNQWQVNSEYLGYSGFIDDTPDQPGTFTGGPQSTYMHITNTSICSGLAVCNANFDTGSSSNRSASITTPIVTTGYTNVNLQFYYLCAGAAGISFGIVEYSTDGGTTWTAASGQYSDVTVWTEVNITNAAFNNQSSLKFRFRWQNGSSGNDPAFSVDEVKITGEAGSFVNVTTGSLGTNNYCTNTSGAITVPFTATGTVNSGNQYIAQLSNSSGSFASPTEIGTLTSTSTGSLIINGTVPSGLAAGTGYLVRVIATDPSSTGTSSSTMVTVNAAPTASIISLPSTPTICEGESITLQGNGGSTYSWSPAATIDNPNMQTVSATPLVTTVYTVTVTASNGCTETSSITVTVDDCASISEQEVKGFEIYPNPANDVLNIQNHDLSGVSGIEIVDLAGRVVKSFTGMHESISIDNLPQGSFILKIQHMAGVSSIPFVKN
jgi:hypothetical protein